MPIWGGRGGRRLTASLSRLTGEPITAAVRVSVRGASSWMIVSLAVSLLVFSSFAYGHGPLAFAIGLVAYVLIACVLMASASAILTSRRGPSGLAAGGVVGVNATTLHLASVNRWTGSAERVLGAWPRAEVSVLSQARDFTAYPLALVFADGIVVPLEVNRWGKLDQIAEPTPWTPPGRPPPGWYADPHAASGVRYWDGQGWTERVIDDPWSTRPVDSTRSA